VVILRTITAEFCVQCRDSEICASKVARLCLFSRLVIPGVLRIYLSLHADLMTCL
jgi:hypothetical protein